MTVRMIAELTKRIVAERGYLPGTTLENTVIVMLTRYEDVPRFEQQYRIGSYRADFAWPEHKIVLEADGWHHRSPEGAAKDRQRDSWLRSQGWLIFRVDDEHGEESLVAQIHRVALVVRLHPSTHREPPRRKRGGCAADVWDPAYDGDSRPCLLSRSVGEFCRVHAKART